ncbi:calcium channel protein [Stygiomarasmius scandens]|uniref:Calcium channel protein n=1 Tax=Marasmiellus scandens TaxID=2682957 RepID=A0ABR1IJC4_9AGAR
MRRGDSVSPSPLKRTGTAIKSTSKTLQRASLQVVNIANNGLEHQVRLAGDDGKLEEDRDEELPGGANTWKDAMWTEPTLRSLEAFARICVNGFLFDPEIPALSIFTSPFSSAPSRTIVSNLPPDSTDLSRQGSLSIGGPLACGLSLTNGLTETSDTLSSSPTHQFP